MENVLPDGISQFALAGVDVSHRVGPGFRMWKRKIDHVAFANMARDNEGSEHGKVCASILEVWDALALDAWKQTKSA